MLTTRIDGAKLSDLSIDQIGAALQAIADELSIRGNGPDNLGKPKQAYLWAFDKLQEVGTTLRRLDHMYNGTIGTCKFCKDMTDGKISCCPFHY